jgi:uncharacterized protein involved in tolerance to divalent cations
MIAQIIVKSNGVEKNHNFRFIGKTKKSNIRMLLENIQKTTPFDCEDYLFLKINNNSYRIGKNNRIRTLRHLLNK